MPQTLFLLYYIFFKIARPFPISRKIWKTALLFRKD